MKIFSICLFSEALFRIILPQNKILLTFVGFESTMQTFNFYLNRLFHEKKEHATAA